MRMEVLWIRGDDVLVAQFCCYLIYGLEFLLIARPRPLEGILRSHFPFPSVTHNPGVLSDQSRTVDLRHLRRFFAMLRCRNPEPSLCHQQLGHCDWTMSDHSWGCGYFLCSHCQEPSWL